MTRPPPTLDYARPRVLFQGVDVGRSRGRKHSIIACVAAAVVVAVIAVARWVYLGGQTDFYVVVCGLGAVGAAGAAARNWWRYHFRIDHVLRITTEGIEHKSKRYPWRRVWRLGGAREADLITLTARVGPRLFLRDITLPITPPLSDEQFTRVMNTIQSQIKPRHPHVKLKFTPVEASGD